MIPTFLIGDVLLSGQSPHAHTNTKEIVIEIELNPRPEYSQAALPTPRSNGSTKRRQNILSLIFGAT